MTSISTDSDSTKGADFPEPGQNAEHSGKIQGRDQMDQDKNIGLRRDSEDTNPEAESQDQDPGERQKRNQSDSKDDDLAA